jgi:hypothetical protein
VYALRERAWRRWQAAAGAWRGWSTCLPLQAPDIDGVTSRPSTSPPAAETLVTHLIESLANDPTLFLVDLDPLLGVHVAAALNRRHLAHAVLVLPRWPYRDAVLPVDNLLHALITQSRRLTPTALPHVVFVLDADRQRSIRRSSRDGRADNRYRLSASDLPPLAALRRAGIQRLVKVAYA